MNALHRILDALEQPDPASALRTLDDAGELTTAIPELGEGKGFEQPPLHHFDVFDHNLAAVEALTRAITGQWGQRLRSALEPLDIDNALAGRVDGFSLLTLTKLACLVHDIAKPYCAAQSEGRLRFPRHGQEGARMLERRLPQLGLPPGAAQVIVCLVRQHLRPAELLRNYPPSDRSIRRFKDSVLGHVLPLMLLNVADGWAMRGPAYTAEHFDRHCALVRLVLDLCEDHE